ncbi:MAG: hypothetical protein ACJ8DC_00625 [Gemmatimonadales bacterium]
MPYMTRDLTPALRAALARFPNLAPDPDRLAEQLAPALSEWLTGRVPSDDVLGLIGSNDTESIETLVLTRIAGHPDGRKPGLLPDTLAVMTGLPSAELGHAVSALVQSGELVRDAWLVRLPDANDLVSRPGESYGKAPQARLVAEEDRLGSDRRGGPDRRQVGERRLFDRRQPEG